MIDQILPIDEWQEKTADPSFSLDYRNELCNPISFPYLDIVSKLLLKCVLTAISFHKFMHIFLPLKFNDMNIFCQGVDKGKLVVIDGSIVGIERSIPKRAESAGYHFRWP